MSGHGHVTLNADGTRARCGGPAICKVCALELKQKKDAMVPKDISKKTMSTIDSFVRIVMFSGYALNLGTNEMLSALLVVQQRLAKKKGLSLDDYLKIQAEFAATAVLEP